MRDVEMSPDGSYFVVATTGGPHSGTLCDTAARFETYAVGTALTPTWTDTSGGDTLWGVEVTQAAVYVGGHNRWMNNPNGSDRAAQGAVPRPGLSALDPQTGVPLKWNPGRNPRGEAAYEIYETDDGVWVVSDTDWIGDRRYQRPRHRVLPLQRGLQHRVEERRLAARQRLRRRAAGGQQRALPRQRRRRRDRLDRQRPRLGRPTTPPPARSTTPAARRRRRARSPPPTWSTCPRPHPLGIWTQERNDPTGGNEMQWTFPVASGHQHPGAALLRQPLELDAAVQRAHRRRHQAVELRPERRPGRQQGHDEVVRHHQRRHRQHRLHPRHRQPGDQRDRDRQQLDRLQLQRRERRQLRRHHASTRRASSAPATSTGPTSAAP